MLTIEEIDPQKLVRNDRNPQSRTTTGAVDDLKASIPVVGILQPLVVIPITEDPGTYRIEIGHRRHRAALELGLPTVPCLVAPDEGVAMQLAAMIAENTHRADFSTSEQAEMYAQLALLDWDEERIAAFTAQPVEHVRAAITLTRLPAAAQAAADVGELTLDDAAALAEFTSDPGTVDKLLKRGANGWRLRHAIADERHKREVQESLDRCKAELVLAGVKVIPTPKNWPYGEQTVVRARDLADADGNRLDPDAVRTRPGFAAIITRDGAGTPRTEIVCTDPAAWGYSPAAGTAEHARAERDAAAARQREFVESFAAATQVRWQFLSQAYGSAKTAKNLYLTALRAAVTDPDRLSYPKDKLQELALRVAGAPFDPAVTATAGIDRLTRMLVSRWICGSEDNLVRLAADLSWGVDPRTAVEYLDLLVAGGYQLSEAETQLQDRLTASSSHGTEDDSGEEDEDADKDTAGEEDPEPVVPDGDDPGHEVVVDGLVEPVDETEHREPVAA
ncbi:ParB/RepB/Spo0J family partition protein [Spirilliplanes yamanashiensis]|uniref:ParB-like N-terminal domain-containing protein n=1 Tax=Spirilliplanes yamanashiensis TaxID=42233 RepID=A0A8J3YED3_9ACTN|nr:ParB/RepB/Spo0J family partition protein [Spirilliplanes yamanashiensis]MDP9818479.1 ParB family chromosome partitioning protein [Spirilliplanes yamanashiensis]GIJ06395.1 hypothetical protein Sya03_57470 [Spirilliplanes yamanashiensis]